MMTSSPLSAGVIRRICEGKCAPTEPIYLQITQIRPLERSDSSSITPSYKIALSDSIYQIQGFIGPNLNHLFDSKSVDTMSLIQVTHHALQSPKGRWYLKVLEVNPTSIIKMVGKIGDPVNIETVLSPPDNDSNPSFASTNQPHSLQKPAFQPQQQNPNRGGFMPQSTNQNHYSTSYNHPPQQPISSNGQFERHTIPPTSTHVGHPQINSDEVMAFKGKQSTISKPPTMQKLTPTVQSSTTMPISALSPYTEGWTIRARCTQKSDIKTWTNAKGEGKLFSAVLIDGTGEIRVTAFNDQVDQFYELIQPGRVYAISSGQVRPAKRAFNTTKNDYEIHLSGHSHVEPDSNVESSLPSAHYDFTLIKDIPQQEKDSLVDVVAIVKEVGECSSITTRTKQQQLSKRDLIVVDDSHHSIRLTLWAQRAEDYDMSIPNPVIVVKSAKVSDYQGRTLSATSAGDVTLSNFEVPRVRELKAWYERIGRLVDFQQLSGQSTEFGTKNERKSIQQVLSECTGTGDKSDYATVIASITSLREQNPLTYAACTTEGCGRKVIEEGPQMYRCERCARSMDRCEHRYSFQVQITDDTSSIWVSIFNETGAVLTGRPAEELHYMLTSNPTEHASVINAIKGTEWTFKLKAKQDTYNGETRIKYSVISVLPVEYKRENEMMMGEVERMMLEME